MASTHFYTITRDSKDYVAVAPFYRWGKVTKYLGAKRDEIRRGGDMLSKNVWKYPEEDKEMRL